MALGARLKQQQQQPWRMLVRALHWEASLKKRTKVAPLQERKMVDRFTLRVRGGHGGSGCTSWRKSRHARHGRVDGGNGGVGGNVILTSTKELWDFSNLQHLAMAVDGGSGSSKKQVGRRGSDEVVLVPLGTVVHLSEGRIPSGNEPRRKVAKASVTGTWQGGDKDWVKLNKIFTKDPYPLKPELDDESTSESEEESKALVDDFENDDDDAEIDDIGAGGSESDNETIRISRPVIKSNVAELLEPGQTFLVAAGGAGGRGNAAMPRGCGREKGLPSFENEPGEPGTEAVLILELKSIADIGLVGAPNAGKSTLLGAISKARPSVGSYPFTTLRPNIGRIEYEDYYSLSVADIPGLMTGAHEDRGLGFDFLRHVERTKAFAYVLDTSLGVGDNKGPYAWDQLQELMYEMECYRSGMTKRPALVVANKIDEEGTDAIVEELRRRVSWPIYPICAVLGEGIDELKVGLRTLLESDDSEIPTLQDLRV